MTTLSDLTPDQHSQTVGMWCEMPSGVLAIVARSAITLCEVYEPTYGTMLMRPTELTLRYDLPRAWNPDRTPPEGEWLTGGTHTRVIPSGNRAYITMSEPEWEQK